MFWTSQKDPLSVPVNVKETQTNPLYLPQCRKNLKARKYKNSPAIAQGNMPNNPIKIDKKKAWVSWLNPSLGTELGKMAREYKGKFLGLLVRPRLVNRILTRAMVKGKILIVDRIEMKVYLLRGRTKSASMLDVSFFFF